MTKKERQDKADAELLKQCKDFLVSAYALSTRLDRVVAIWEAAEDIYGGPNADDEVFQMSINSVHDKCCSMRFIENFVDHREPLIITDMGLRFAGIQTTTP